MQGLEVCSSAAGASLISMLRVNTLYSFDEPDAIVPSPEATSASAEGRSAGRSHFDYHTAQAML